MRKYCHLLFTVLIVAAFWSALGSSGASPIAAAHDPKAGADDAAKLQGVWIVEYTEHGIKKLMQRQRFIFVGNRFFRLDGDKVVVEGTFTIDTSGPVKKIDYRFLKGFRDRQGNDKVMTRPAIYELDGDSYREFGPWGTDLWDKRPAAFADKTDLTNYLRVMKREKL
jgi:uncharacterized protein (TIGR03067 family)